MAKKKTKSPVRGRPPVSLTDDQKKSVEVLAGYGMTVEQVACVLGMNLRTFNRHVFNDKLLAESGKAGPNNLYVLLLKGRAMSDANLARTLYQMATVDKDVTAAIFLAKTRLRWSEHHSIEVFGQAGGPIQVGLTVADLTREVRKAIEEGGHLKFE